VDGNRRNILISVPPVYPRSNNRHRSLLPLFEQTKIVLSAYCTRTIYDGTTTDFVQDFIEQEYIAFPVLQHDDMLDALSGICDEKELQLRWPQTDLQRVQRQANLPGSYHLPTDGNGTPMSHVERHRAIMTGRRTGGCRQPRGRPQESGVGANGTGWK